MYKIIVKNGLVGEGVDFERVRRITGYLTTTKRANNAKSAEFADRIPHPLTRRK